MFPQASYNIHLIVIDQGLCSIFSIFLVFFPFTLPVIITGFSNGPSAFGSGAELTHVRLQGEHNRVLTVFDVIVKLVDKENI